MSRRPPTATRTDPLFPDTTLFRSLARRLAEAAVGTQVEPLGRREDALPLLIFEDGVGQVIGLFEQHMAEPRSEEHTSELQSLMRNSYAVFCLKKKNQTEKEKSVKHSGP